MDFFIIVLFFTFLFTNGRFLLPVLFFDEECNLYVRSSVQLDQSTKKKESTEKK